MQLGQLVPSTPPERPRRCRAKVRVRQRRDPSVGAFRGRRAIWDRARAEPTPPEVGCRSVPQVWPSERLCMRRNASMRLTARRTAAAGPPVGTPSLCPTGGSGPTVPPRPPSRCLPSDASPWSIAGRTSPLEKPCTYRRPETPDGRYLSHAPTVIGVAHGRRFSA